MTASAYATSANHQPLKRRGMLLLLVLLMLAVFLGLGIFAMTTATRSRTLARAYVNQQGADTEQAAMARSLLDQALMRLVRGPSSPGAMNDIPESLLEDMYCGERDLNRNNIILTSDDDIAEIDIDDGKLDIDNAPQNPKQPTRSDSLTGRLVGRKLIPGPAGPFTRVTVELYFENDQVDADGLWVASQDLNNNGMFDPRPGVPSPLPPPSPGGSRAASPPVVFNGRVITFCPLDVETLTAGTAAVAVAPGRSTLPVSFRIVRSQFANPAPGASVFRCRYEFVLVDASGRPNPRVPPAPCDVVINGPAFRVDPCDDLFEPWLDRDISRSGFAGIEVDNDNDGIADGRWLSQVLPVIRRADGSTIRCDVSILVKDLDGRINVNAHGFTHRHSETGKPYRARAEYGYLRRTVPIGLGFGTAEIEASALFSTAAGFVADQSERPHNWFDGRLAPVASTWDALLRGDLDPSVPSYPIPDPDPWLQRRPSPVLGSVVGRYGVDGRPGIEGQDPGTRNQDEELLIKPYGDLTSKANSLTDLKGRMQVSSQLPVDEKGVATLLFYLPDGDADTVDDPYELRLDGSGPRFGAPQPIADQAADHLFTLSELERVLRQTDPDASMLPPRLAALLGSRLKEDRNEDGQMDAGESDPNTQESGDVDPMDDGEDRARGGKPPNGILDKDEDANGNGYLDLASDLNGSGFRDTPEDRNRDNTLGRYWPREAGNPPDFPRESWERDFTETLRDLITTDSWDTPGLTGLAAKRVEKYLIDYPQVIPHFSPDCLSGLRFDLNRPLPDLDPQAKQDYCKHLFYLLTALGATSPRDAAQWAANIVDFRDADSVMTAFRYDPQPNDGWDSPTEVVFGVERPELLVSEAVAWVKDGTQGQIFVMLHRPWNAIARTFVNAGGGIPPQVSPPRLAEPIDVRLTVSSTVGLANINTARLKETGDSNGNGVAEEPALDLELQCPGPPNTPVWRLVINPGPAEKIVRFDKPPFGANEFGASTNRAALRAVTAMPANSYLCVTSGPPQEGITVSGNTFAIDSGNLFVSAAGNMVVELQRLADPWKAYDAVNNPHVPVDRLNVRNIDRSLDPNTNLPQKPWQRTKRAWSEPELGAELSDPSTPADPTKTLTNFWRSTRLVDGGPRLIPPDAGTDPWYPDDDLPKFEDFGDPLEDKQPSLGPLDFVAPWLHWPNRPFISAGELLLVPAQAAADSLQNYKLPCTDPNSSASAEQLIFDACHVYTRFAGNRITLSGSNNLAVIGAERIPFDQLSSWREPGRVNLYTGTSAVVRALVGGRHDGREYLALAGPGSVLKPGANDAIRGMAPTMRPTAALLCNAGDKLISEGDGDGSTAPVFMNIAPEYAIKQAALVAAPDPADHIPFNPSLNPFFLFRTAIRMPNVATTRSHVFAVWITLRMTDTSDSSQVTFRRLFAIVDRSIPVGFIHGMDLNARDTVRLYRYLD